MTTFVLAAFQTAHEASAAARQAAAAGMPALDVLSPNPIEGIAEQLAPRPATAPIGWVMVGAGAFGAVAGYAMQWYSAVIAYPILSGGRPLDSWPVFLLVPYEITILFAAICGILAWLWMCGLPRLFHPLFDIPTIEHATQDRYFLVFAQSDAAARWLKANFKSASLHEARR